MWTLAAIGLAGALAGCGGSGGGGDSTAGTGGPPAANEYQLKDSYVTYLSSGFKQKFKVTGVGVTTCAGTEEQVSDPPFVTKFNGKDAFAILLSDKLELQNCPNLTSPSSEVLQYFNTDFEALGTASVRTGSYGVFVDRLSGVAVDKPVTYPANVQAGDKGVLGVQRLYLDSRRSIFIGQQVLSYEARADTPASTNSLLILFTVTGYDTSDPAVPTGGSQTATYRLGKDRSFKVLSIDVRDANGQRVLLEPIAP